MIAMTRIIYQVEPTTNEKGEAETRYHIDARVDQADGKEPLTILERFTDPLEAANRMGAILEMVHQRAGV